MIKRITQNGRTAVIEILPHDDLSKCREGLGLKATVTIDGGEVWRVESVNRANLNAVVEKAHETAIRYLTNEARAACEDWLRDALFVKGFVDEAMEA